MGADGVTGTVAVMVTAGGPEGVATEPAASADGVPPEDSSRKRTGARATPSAAAEVRTTRRDGGQGSTDVRGAAGGPGVAAPVGSAFVTYAVPAHGSRPSARAERGWSRRAVSSSYAAEQCAQRAMWVCRSVLERGLSGRTDSSISRMEVSAARIVRGGQPVLQTGLAQGLECLGGAVRDVLGRDAEHDRRPFRRFALHDRVPDEPLGAGREGLEGREQRRDGAAGARRAEDEEQAGVEARGPLVPGPRGRRHPPGEQQELVPPGDVRVDAACRLAGREGEGLRGELAGPGVAGGAQPGVGEDRGAVACAEFLEGRVRGRGPGAQQLGQPRVGRVRGQSVAPGRGVSAGRVALRHVRPPPRTWCVLVPS